MPTPNIDAAIRAGCDPGRLGDPSACRYPACAGECDETDTIIISALRAAIPREPPYEIIAAMASAAMANDSWSHVKITKAYKANPIYRELYRDDSEGDE